MMVRRNSKGKSPVKFAVVLVVLIVVAVGLVVAKPWEMLGFGNGTVRFYAKAYFYLTGTEDNGPLENVEISLPDLTAGDNEIFNRGLAEFGYWTLYASIDSIDNQFVVEAQTLINIQIVSPRTSEPIIDGGPGTSAFGPKYNFTIDRLYPGEMIQTEGWWEIPAGMADKITLWDTNNVGYPTAAFIYSDPLKKINGSFSVGLYRLDKDNRVQQVVEEFSYAGENVLSGYWWGLAQV